MEFVKDETLRFKRLLAGFCKLGRYYIGIRQQRDIYDALLKELQDLYRRNSRLFSEIDIRLIQKIKKWIEQHPDTEIPQRGSLKLLEGYLVFHGEEYYVGQLEGETKLKNIFEDPYDRVEYRVRLRGEAKRKIASPKNLTVIGDAQQVHLLRAPIHFPFHNLPEEYRSIWTT